jgi:DNA polymerase-1
MNYELQENSPLPDGLKGRDTLSLDSETTGLMPFHGDRVFASVLSNGEDSYYVEGMPSWLVDLFMRKDLYWYLHNASFDLHSFRETFGITPLGEIHDTLVHARLEFNDHLSYGLDACAKRIGLEKSDEVEKYISEHQLWEWETVPGKKTRRKNKFYQKVPRAIMVKYACQDALITYKLGEHQKKRIAEIDALLPEAPALGSVAVTERSLSPVVARMEARGLRIAQGYCEKSIEHYTKVLEDNQNGFREVSGRDYKASPKLFEDIFSSEKSKWAYTEKGNPSFESDTISKFDSPAAKHILAIRNAKSRLDFFSGFLFHSDLDGFVHPSFKSGGTATGRFSSSDPNFQNCTNDEESKEEYPVRRAIVPPGPEYRILSIDYDQQEYRLMLDYAGEMGVIEQVKAGADVHQATADLMGVSRRYAKTLNFALLYGSGVKNMAELLGVSESEARDLKAKYFSALPKVEKFINRVIQTARARGYVYNWAGRRYFCEREHAYKMPNRVIQGGGADIMKRSMVLLDSLLKPYKTHMVLTVHDELDFYLHEREHHLVPEIKKIMEGVYPSKHLPLTVSISSSSKSLGDLGEGLA